MDKKWFILHSDNAYKKRFCIEEMFLDFKKGGYDLERTKLTGHRLTSLIILIVLAYSMATFSGKIIKDKGLGKDWVDSCDLFAVESQALMQLSPSKCAYSRQGRRAISLIKSSL